MMERFTMIRPILAALVITMGIGMTMALPVSAQCSGQGFDCVDEGLGSRAARYNTVSSASDRNPLATMAGTITTTLLFVVGAAAIAMLIFGAIQYTTSSGNKEKTSKAKDTIMYALIGLAVALLAYAIVNFVITKVGA